MGEVFAYKKHEDLVHGNPSDKSKKALLTSLLHRFYRPLSAAQKTVSGRQADNSIFFCSKTFSAFSQTKFQSHEIGTPNSKEMRHKYIKRAIYRFEFNTFSLFEPFTTRCLCVKG